MTLRARLALLASLPLPLLAAYLWGFAVEPGRIVTREVTVDAPGWDADLRIVVLSDIHVGAPHITPEHLAAVADAAVAAEPDVILLGGDFVIDGVKGGTHPDPEVLTAPLSRLSAPLGVYSVLGNHDYWNDEVRIRKAIEAAGITVLEDEVARVGGDGGFWLLGIGNMWTEPHDLQGTVAKVPDDGTPAVLLTHTPDVFPDTGDRFALSIAGHTHGGQVWLPLLGTPVVPSAYGQRYSWGHIVEDGRHLVVSPGVGTSILPVRFMMPPEVTVISLR